MRGETSQATRLAVEVRENPGRCVHALWHLLPSLRPSAFAQAACTSTCKGHRGEIGESSSSSEQQVVNHNDLMTWSASSIEGRVCSHSCITAASMPSGQRVGTPCAARSPVRSARSGTCTDAVHVTLCIADALASQLCIASFLVRFFFLSAPIGGWRSELDVGDCVCRLRVPSLLRVVCHLCVEVTAG